MTDVSWWVDIHKVINVSLVITIGLADLIGEVEIGDLNCDGNWSDAKLVTG